MREPCSKGLHDLALPGALTNASQTQRCNECRKAYLRDYMSAQRKDLQQALDQVKVERGCARCGYNENAWALQWDHVIGLSRTGGDRGRSPGRFTNWSDFNNLINDASMQVLCANCHCIKTRTEREHVSHTVPAWPLPVQTPDWLLPKEPELARLW